MLKKFKYILLTLFVSIFMFDINVYAASNASMSWSGTSTVTPGQTFTLDIVASASTGGGSLMSAGGVITSTNSSCITFVSLAKVASGTVNNNKFAYSDMDGNSSSFTIARATFKAGSSSCSTTVNITEPKLAFTDSTKLTPSTISKTITVGASAPAKSNDATLKGLVPSVGTLSPAFASGTTSYSITLDDTSISTVNFTATVNNSKATVSGTTCSISSNPTTCSIVVTAEDGTKKTYSVSVSKKTPTTPTDPGDKKSSDATLKSLDVSGYTLSPKFSKTTTTYSMTVKNNITGLDVTAIPTDSKSTVKITGNSNWKVGVNPVKITVTAEDGSTKVYTVNVTRKAEDKPDNPKTEEEKKSDDNYLSDIVLSDGVLSPKFKKDVSEYSVTVPYDVTKLNIDPVKSSDKATVVVRGNSNFKVGEINVVTIDVTAEDGSLRAYTINVTRSDKKADNLLDDLIIEDGELDPEFDPNKTEYTIDVGNGTDKLNIKAITNNPKAKVQIIGNENLKPGKNKISVIVTDENGFSKVYTIYAYKSDAKKWLGLSIDTWFIILGLLLLLLLLLIFLLLLLFRKKDKKEEKAATVIEFKPEFNFSSKNGTDDDIVEEGGVLNQYTGVPMPPQQEKEEPVLLSNTRVLGLSSREQEANYDLYDDVVTKEELITAINEARENNDTSLLEMLIAQEKLNRKKEELKKKRHD